MAKIVTRRLRLAEATSRRQPFRKEKEEEKEEELESLVYGSIMLKRYQ